MRLLAAMLSVLSSLVASGCGGGRSNPAANVPQAPLYRGGDAPLSLAADRTMLEIPAGKYIAGSTPEERERAYADYLATAGHEAARKYGWFEREEDRHVAELPGFAIDLQPVTQAAYAEFVRDTGAALPFIDEAAWQAQGYNADYETQVRRFNWLGDAPPSGREDHPVVLVTWREASDYCAWRGALVGQPRRLPTEHEFEKAARGTDGAVYPWGEDFDATKLDSVVEGPEDTVAVGSFPDGASPYGMLDAAGNVFQWTSSPWTFQKGRMTVKGSAWDDYAGLGRGSFRHGRPPGIRHVLVGFRCAADAADR